jgi:glutamate 5-kinase
MEIELPNCAKIEVKRVVLKLGTKQITDLNRINYENISRIVESIVALRKKGVEFVLTVSGAIGLGIYEFFQNAEAIEKLSLSQKQALAGVGQVRLMELFKAEFAKHQSKIGQVLLTYYILDNREAYLNAKNTLNSMLEMNIIPIINENDSVAVEEIKVGDNDRLGAFVSLLVDADLYIMLSDIDGFYKNYHTDSQELIRVVENVNQVLKYAGKQEENYTKGGMITKLEAAKISTLSGVSAVIANGFKKDILGSIFNGLSEGTIFLPAAKSLSHKKRWISAKKTKGKILIDDGAKEAIRRNKSLLPSGVLEIEGPFHYGDPVLVADKKGNEIAIGLVNYSSEEIRIIAGKKNNEVEAILGKENRYSCVIHIDNMVLYNV